MKVGHHANKMKMGRGRLRGKTGQHNTTAVQEGITWEQQRPKMAARVQQLLLHTPFLLPLFTITSMASTSMAFQNSTYLLHIAVSVDKFDPYCTASQYG